MNFLLTFDTETATFIQHSIRSIFMSIDILVYKFFAFLYRLFVYVANVELYNNEIVESLVDRIWLVIGVFALFNCAVSLLKLIVSPDGMNDKSKGMGSIIKRILVSVVLLISINAIFQEARDLQTNVLFSENNNVVSNFLGIVNNSENNNNNDPGVVLSTNVFFGFFIESEKFNSAYITTTDIKNQIISSYSTADTRYIGSSWSSLQNYVNVVEVESGKGTFYVYEYNYLISTVAGIFLIYIMINYCFSVGVRVFKLIFLQMISPLPIIMSVTEKGQESLKKWGKQCISTYLEIIIKLFIINLAVVFTQVIIKSDLKFNEAVGSSMESWIKIVLILSALMFAKKAMDIIKDIFPSAGDSGLGLKKMFGGMLGAGVIGGAVGAGVSSIIGGTGAAIGNIANAKQNKKTWYEGVGSALAGFGSGAFRGMKAGYKNGVKGGIPAMFGAGTGAWTAASRARNARAAGYNISDKMADKFTDYSALAKATGTTSEIKDRMKAYDEQIANFHRDETAASEALRTLMTSNSVDYAKYSKAFDRKLRVDDVGKPILGANNEFQYDYTNLEFATRREKIYDKDGKDTGETRIIIEWDKMAADPSTYHTEGLSATQLESYYGIQQARDKADNNARKVEKEKKKLSEASEQSRQAKK